MTDQTPNADTPPPDGQATYAVWSLEGQSFRRVAEASPAPPADRATYGVWSLYETGPFYRRVAEVCSGDDTVFARFAGPRRWQHAESLMEKIGVDADADDERILRLVDAANAAAVVLRNLQGMLVGLALLNDKHPDAAALYDAVEAAHTRLADAVQAADVSPTRANCSAPDLPTQGT